MLNIEVLNCDDKYILYEWNSMEDFIDDIDSEKENIPMLDDVLVSVEAPDLNLDSWWESADNIIVNDLYNECKKRITE